MLKQQILWSMIKPENLFTTLKNEKEGMISLRFIRNHDMAKQQKKDINSEKDDRANKYFKYCLGV